MFGKSNLHFHFYTSDTLCNKTQNLLFIVTSQVHCNAGVSRSATICIAYIMATKQLTLTQALELVKSVKKDVKVWKQSYHSHQKPNDGFMAQLQLYNAELFDNNLRVQDA